MEEEQAHLPVDGVAVPHKWFLVATKKASISSSVKGDFLQEIKRVGWPSESGMRAKNVVVRPFTRFPEL